jgi:hypothetical protein
MYLILGLAYASLYVLLFSSYISTTIEVGLDMNITLLSNSASLLSFNSLSMLSEAASCLALTLTFPALVPFIKLLMFLINEVMFILLTLVDHWEEALYTLRFNQLNLYIDAVQIYRLRGYIILH